MMQLKKMEDPKTKRLITLAQGLFLLDNTADLRLLFHLDCSVPEPKADDSTQILVPLWEGFQASLHL